jgi:hypothetical protein
MRHIVLIQFILLFTCSDAQVGKERDISFIIKDSKIISDGDKISMIVEIKNNTGNAYLFYAFNLLNEALEDESFYTESDDITSGISVFILDLNGDRIFPSNFFVSPPSNIDYKPITLDTLSNSLIRTARAYREGTLHLRPYSSKTTQLNLSFKFHNLESGEYKLFLLYYSGKNLYNIVAEEIVRSDERAFNAQEFRGWVKSNSVKIIIE